MLRTQQARPYGRECILRRHNKCASMRLRIAAHLLCEAAEAAVGPGAGFKLITIPPAGSSALWLPVGCSHPVNSKPQRSSEAGVSVYSAYSTQIRTLKPPAHKPTGPCRAWLRQVTWRPGATDLAEDAPGPKAHYERGPVPE